jgi:phi13 family phage major tail protein
MNGFTKLAFYKITVENIDGTPTYDTEPVKLYSGSLTNNISITITPNTATKTRRADNLIEETETVETYDAELVAYGIDKASLATLLKYDLDDDGVQVLHVNHAKDKFGVFFETVDENNGKKLQIYLAKVKFSDILPSAQTDEKGDPVSTTMNLKGELVIVNGQDSVGWQVYEGDTGFVATGLPSTFLVPTFTPAE